MDTMLGGFRERAQRTYELLKAPGTAFVVVAAPESDALREAAYFVERLSDEAMPLAGLVVNRVHRTSAPKLTARRCVVAAENLEERGEDLWAAAMLRVHADRVALQTREQRLRQRFTEAHPTVPVAEVGAQDGDVHDLDGLRRVGADLAGERLARTG
jgi:anion-transporting  ArsA/GET3 family ATPase